MSNRLPHRTHEQRLRRSRVLAEGQAVRAWLRGADGRQYEPEYWRGLHDDDADLAAEFGFEEAEFRLICDNYFLGSHYDPKEGR